MPRLNPDALTVSIGSIRITMFTCVKVYGFVNCWEFSGPYA